MTETQLKLTFLGGAHEIGASSTLVEVNDTRLLIDCGVRFTPSNPLPDLSMLQDKHLDAIAVTHAHSDHTGGLPIICDAFPSAPVYTTSPTQDLTQILLGDALKLMGIAERDAEVPLYSEKQVNRVKEAFSPVQHGDCVEVGDITLTFLPAGHILGASMIHLATPAGNVLFTGDYSIFAQHTIPAPTVPHLHTDMVVTEATYGDRLHSDRDAAERRMIDQLNSVIETGGRILIPAFAVGRAQEVLLILKRALRNKTIPEVPVFVDGMVRSVCDIYSRHPRYVSRALFHDIKRAAHPFYTNGIEPVTTPAERSAVLEQGPCIIVASSGMLNGGASAAYAAQMVGNEKDAVFITGYQDEESPGRALLNLADTQTDREIKLAGRTYPVRCRFEKYGLSAHADRMQMAGLVERMRPRTVVLVHGDPAAKNTLADSLGAGDIVLASNGQQLTRGYPLRKSPSPVKDHRPIDVAAARRILGPSDGPPVPAAQTAEAWYGRRVNRETAERFATELEKLGLVRRDDERRMMLHILPPSQTDAFPAEAAVEEALKKENPKGKLLEFCMRQRIDAPTYTLTENGPFYEAAASLILDTERIESGRHSAASKRTAEQLAARALLRIVQNKTNNSQSVAWITDDQISSLKNANPKGRLFEWCTAHDLSSPSFTLNAVVGGFHSQAAVQTADGDTIVSSKMGAANKKTAEQAAAKALLDTLMANAPVETPAQNSPPPQPARPSEPSQQSGRDPQMLLNEMRQLGLLQDFGYDIQTDNGPNHQPLFSITGWATLEDGETVDAETIIAPAKKAGKRDAAAQIVERLRELGMLSR